MRTMGCFQIIGVEGAHELDGRQCGLMANVFSVHSQMLILFLYVDNNITMILKIILLAVASVCLHVDPTTSFLQDQFGRYAFIHGINSVYKEFPYYPKIDGFDPSDSLSVEDFRNLKNWGFRSLRLYIAWEGFEPEERQYNYTYLNELKRIVKMAQNYNISVIIDAHHDLYSRKFCGQGFPNWLVKVKTFPAPLKVKLEYDENGIPLKQSCKNVSFFKYYITEDVMGFSNDFFTNKNGMNDKFVQMWINVVSFFKSQPNVLGYDLLNEPSGANAWKDPYNFFGPGVNNNKYLLPLYKKLVNAIRQIDQEKLILFEPSVADYIGGFYDTPNHEFNNKNILSYHTYCPFKNSHAEPTSKVKCNLIDGLYMALRYQNIKKLKIGGMMTEFGSVPESKAGIEEINRVLRYAEKNWQNWYYWQYKNNSDSTCSSNPSWEHAFYYPNGTVQLKKVHALSYPYAYAICGSPVKQTHDDHSYSLTFKPKKCQNRNTQIYLNEDLYFQNGFNVVFSPKCENCRLEAIDKNYYQVIVDDKMLYSKFTVTVAGFMQQ